MAQDLAQAPEVAPPRENVEVEAPQQRAGSNAQQQQRAQPGRAGPATPGAPTTPAGPTNPLAEDQALRDLITNSPGAQAIETIAALPNAALVSVISRARTLNVLQSLFGKLPHGTALTAATRVAVKRVADHGSVTLPELAQLFQIRFQHAAVREQRDWDPAILRAVWAQLESLPDQDVTTNTVLTTFTAINGGGGTGPSWEAPGQINTIRLGQSAHPSQMAHTVRHEVGHAVHAQIRDQVNPWLRGEMQFWFLDGNKSGVRRFLEAVDAWPANFTPTGAAARTFGDAEKDKVAEMLETWMGRAAWGPSRANPTDGQAAEVTAMWNACTAKMKNAVTQSTTNWYNNHANFQVGTNGNKYFLNHYYHRPYHIGPQATAVIGAVGDNYTAMSEQEFFANAYAEYFKDPAGYTDRSKWGGRLPANVKDFFTRVVLSRQPYQAPAPRAAAPAAGAPATTQRPRSEGTQETDSAQPGPGVQGLPMQDATGSGMPT